MKGDWNTARYRGPPVATALPRSGCDFRLRGAPAPRGADLSGPRTGADLSARRRPLPALSRLGQYRKRNQIIETGEGGDILGRKGKGKIKCKQSLLFSCRQRHAHAARRSILDTFRDTITESSCLSLPRLEHFWNLSILASHVIIGFVVVVEFRNLRHVCVVRHALHENCMNSENLKAYASHRMRGTLSRQVGKG